jgi:flavin-dependent dehydrogenase
LLDAAVRDGVVFHPAEDVQAIEAKENSVILHGKDGGRRTGRLLIAADGCDSLAVRTFGLRRPGVSERCDVCCQAAVPLPASAVRSKPETRDLLKWILTAEDLSSFGYIFRAGRDLVIGLVSPPPATGAAAEIRQTFARVVAAWQKAEIIPGHLGVDASNVEIRPVPRGLALERDTHVAKHSLVIGDAGGFVVAISHEGLHPALMSGMLAAEVCAQALESSYPQDVLAEFDTKWRVGLAEFLRSPNADLRFLLPLVFTNARIAGRIANWFLCVKTPRTSEAP